MSTPLGHPVRRREDAALLTGNGRFVDDLDAPADTAYIAFVRSPYAKARIRAVDTTRAKQAPGVVLAVTGQDLEDVPEIMLNQRAPGMRLPPNPVMARGTVNVVGVIVAAVVARSRAEAEDGAGLVETDFEPLDAIADATAALDADAPRAWEDLESNLSFTNSRAGGDVEQAFNHADHVVRLSVRNPRLAPTAIEPRAALAVPDPMGDALTLFVGAQSPFRLRAPLARHLGLAENRVHVVSRDVGGAFGAKNAIYREYVVAAWCALRLKRPVKWVATRSEEFLSMQHGRDSRVEVALAVKRDGTFTGLRVRSVANLGAYLQAAAVAATGRPLTQSPGMYAIPSAQVTVDAALTNTGAVGPYRGLRQPRTPRLICPKVTNRAWRRPRSSSPTPSASASAHTSRWSRSTVRRGASSWKNWCASTTVGGCSTRFS